ncbi:hypothetical protein GS415_06685 [Rhodococcus hoagii]|nr:hypothetical protein [Prescottella equi]
MSSRCRYAGYLADKYGRKARPVHRHGCRRGPGRPMFMLMAGGSIWQAIVGQSVCSSRCRWSTVASYVTYVEMLKASGPLQRPGPG